MGIAVVVTTETMSELEAMVERDLESKYDLSFFLKKATEKIEQT